MFVPEALILTFMTTPLVTWLYPLHLRTRIAGSLQFLLYSYFLKVAYALFIQILHSVPSPSLCIEDDDDKMSGSNGKSAGGMTGRYR
jgi:hypothetical protein